MFLHCGDFDPSGESIFEAMTVDAKQFMLQGLLWKLKAQGVEGETLRQLYWSPGQLYPHSALPGDWPNLLPTRLALTGDQVDEFDLPTAPPKASDTRSASWVGETCQLEALPPDQLAELVEEGIRGVLDEALLDEATEAEGTERRGLSERLRLLERNPTIPLVEPDEARALYELLMDEDGPVPAEVLDGPLGSLATRIERWEQES